MLHIILEDEETANIRCEIKRMSIKQLRLLEALIKREMQSRNDELFSQWLEKIAEIKSDFV